MRIVAAIGGNALLERGEAPDAQIQQHHIRSAVDALASVARTDQLIVTHGNGPQVGLLALESATDPALARPYPLDVLGAQTQGMIGYWLLQGFQNTVPDREVASVITQTLVSAADPAFAAPTKFVGPVYPKPRRGDSPASEAGRLTPTATPGGESLPRPPVFGWSRPGSSANSSTPTRLSSAPGGGVRNPGQRPRRSERRCRSIPAG